MLYSKVSRNISMSILVLLHLWFDRISSMLYIFYSTDNSWFPFMIYTACLIQLVRLSINWKSLFFKFNMGLVRQEAQKMKQTLVNKDCFLYMLDNIIEKHLTATYN